MSTIKNYVLDTNVLIHNPRSIFDFEDNNLFIPIYVLEELDKIKSESSPRGRNARETCRILEEFRKSGDLVAGVQLSEDEDSTGTLFIYVPTERKNIAVSLDRNCMDSAILQCAKEIQETKEADTILVTMDVNMRIRSACLGVPAQKFESDAVDTSNMITGYSMLEIDLEDVNALHKTGLEVDDVPEDTDIYHNLCATLIDPTETKHLARYSRGDNKFFPIDKTIKRGVMGIKPRNDEQALALDMLLDPEVQIVTLVGMAGSGKAQPLDSKVLTPTGFVKMGDVKVGDYVSTPDGKKAKINGVFPQGEKEIFKVTFSDGTSTECCKEHLWKTQTCRERDKKEDGKVRSTEEIIKTLRLEMSNSSKTNHSIPISEPIEFKKSELPLDPYSFGALLGDGCLKNGLYFSSIDKFILDKLNDGLNKIDMRLKKVPGDNCDHIIVGTKKISKKVQLISTDHNGVEFKTTFNNEISLGRSRKLINKAIDTRSTCYNLKYRKSGYVTHVLLDYLRKNELKCTSEFKFIPNEYKYTSISDRVELLKGLMDTDGTVSKCGKDITYTSISERLAGDVKELVQGLGGTATIRSRYTHCTYNGEKKTGKKSYTVRLCMPNNINPFGLERKRSRVVKRTKYYPRRYIKSVESIGKKEAQCISIDSDNHLYLTNDYIVTHNTLLALAAALAQTVDGEMYNKILVSRPIIPMGNDLGFLPGSVEEKMAPWMQPIVDNLELLMMSGGKRKFGGMNHEDLFDKNIIQVEPITYIRGRSIPHQFIIIDEAQNLSPHELKTIITRCGEGTKIVLTGDPEQIDSPYIDAGTCGLSVVVDKLHDKPLVGHITLQKGERSKLANLAAKHL